MYSAVAQNAGLSGIVVAADLLCVAWGTGSQDDAAGVFEEEAFDDDERI